MIGIVIGLALKLIGMIVFAALIVAGVLFVAKLMRGSNGAPYCSVNTALPAFGASITRAPRRMLGSE